MPTVDAIVVGGGAVGVSTARALAERGVRRVALVERSHLASGFTSRAAGIVSALTWDVLDAHLVRRSAAIYRETARTAPGRFRFLGGGMLSVVSGEGGRRTMAARVERLAAEGVRVETLTAGEALSRWPDLRLEGVSAAWFTPDDGHVYAYDFVRVIGDELRARRVEIRADAPVRRLAVRGGRVEGVETDEEFLAADLVIVAAGVWSRRVLQSSGVDGLDIPLKPYRTQVAVLEAAGPARIPIFHEMSLGFYWIPDAAKIIFGDGTEEVESDPNDWLDANDEAFLLSVAERLPERFAGGREARHVGGWAGLCDATPDRRPLLGPYGGIAGLHLACGFNGFGVMRAPAVGEAVAALALGQDPGLDLSTHLAGRFRGFTDFEIRQGFSLAD